MKKAIEARGGLPPKAGEPSRSPSQRVLEVRWQLKRFAEMLQWDEYVAKCVMKREQPFHFSVMTMNFEGGKYDGIEGSDLYTIDWQHLERIDPAAAAALDMD